MAPANDALRETLQATLDGAAFAQLYGFRLESVGDGECLLRVPFQPAFERPGGIVSGPVMMAAADAALWLAILTRIGTEGHVVTVEMNTAFLSGARRSDVFCRARVLRVGGRMMFGTAECRDENDKLLTHHTMTYARANIERNVESED